MSEVIFMAHELHLQEKSGIGPESWHGIYGKKNFADDVMRHMRCRSSVLRSKRDADHEGLPGPCSDSSRRCRVQNFRPVFWLRRGQEFNPWRGEDAAGPGENDVRGLRRVRPGGQRLSRGPGRAVGNLAAAAELDRNCAVTAPAARVGYFTPFVACSIRAATALGLETWIAWLPGTSTTVAPARSAMYCCPE